MSPNVAKNTSKNENLPPSFYMEADQLLANLKNDDIQMARMILKQTFVAGREFESKMMEELDQSLEYIN